MDTRPLHFRALFRVVGAMVAACLMWDPASAGDNVQVVPVCADKRGNQAWVEIESSGGRETATPLVAIGDGRIVRMLEGADDDGNLVIPVPRLMRLVERARKAVRAMKRPAANDPAARAPSGTAAAQAGGPVSGPRETPPDRTGSSAPPGKTGTGNPASDAAYRTATR